MTQIPHNWPRPPQVYNRSIARAETPRQLAAAARFLAARRRNAWPASFSGSFLLTAGATTTIRQRVQLGPLDLYALCVLHLYSVPTDARACEVNITRGAYTGQTRVLLGFGDNLIETQIQVGAGALAAPSTAELTIAVTIAAGDAGYYLDSCLVKPLPMGSPWSSDTL